MPPPRVSQGFAARNVESGDRWSSLTSEEKAIFHPDKFPQLAVTTYLSDLPSTADPTTITLATPSLETASTAEELEVMVTNYRRLVNTCKVATEICKGKFSNGKVSSTDDKWGQKEIGKIAGRVSTLEGKNQMEHPFELIPTNEVQLQSLFTSHRINFHLLVATWNPDTTLKNALWQEEYTSCDEWAIQAQSKWHLLECFSHEATKAPPAICIKSRGKKPQELLRSSFKDLLNGLIRWWT